MHNTGMQLVIIAALTALMYLFFWCVTDVLQSTLVTLTFDVNFVQISSKCRDSVYPYLINIVLMLLDTRTSINVRIYYAAPL